MTKLRWTLTIPTKEGWYWRQSIVPNGPGPHIVYVWREPGSHTMINTAAGDCFEWAGPIPEPTAPAPTSSRVATRATPRP
jgi:hypothetical protein